MGSCRTCRRLPHAVAIPNADGVTLRALFSTSLSGEVSLSVTGPHSTVTPLRAYLAGLRHHSEALPTWPGHRVHRLTGFLGVAPVHDGFCGLLFTLTSITQRSPETPTSQLPGWGCRFSQSFLGPPHPSLGEVDFSIYHPTARISAGPIARQVIHTFLPNMWPLKPEDTVTGLIRCTSRTPHGQPVRRGTTDERHR